MKFLQLTLLISLILMAGIKVHGQALGDYQTNANVTFAAAANWQRYDGTSWVAAVAAPTSANGVITVRNGHTATAGANVTLDQVVIASGGIITVNGGVTLTIANGAGTDMAVDGTLRNAGTITTTGTLVFNNGGTYQHNFTTTAGTIPTATWSSGSTCEIIGYTAPGNGTTPAGLGQAFSNFTWNCASQSDRCIAWNAAMTVSGNYTVSNTGSDFISYDEAAATVSIAGNYVQSGGEMRLTRNNTNVTVSIAGNLTLSGGTLNIDDGNGGSTLNLAGNLSISNGALSSTDGASALNFTKAGLQTYSKTGGTINNTINFTVNNNANLDVGTSLVDGSAGTFTLSSGATLTTANTNGIAATGASGSIQVTGTRTYNTGANYVYNGSGAQVTGGGLPASVNNLTINNSAGVTPSGNVTVNGVLDNQLGALDISGRNLTLAGTVTRGGAGTGTITSSTTSNLTISGTGALGTLYFTPGSETLNNLSVNRTASGSIALGTALTINGTLTPTAGQINTAFNLTLNSNPACGGGGSINASAGTVSYANTATNIIPGTYNNLTKSGAATASLCGFVTVNGILNFNSCNLSLGSANYDLTLGNSASITGSFSNTHMIVCNGTGSVIKQSTADAGFVMVYPIGTNGYYTPFEITSLTASVAGTGDIRVRAVTGSAPGPPAANPTDLQKYWILTTNNLSGISAGISFTYVNPDEVGTGGDQSTYVPSLFSGGAWSTPSGSSGGGVNPMTIAGTGTIAGTWTAREAPMTYYSYQSGSWGTALTWTTDPSGTLSVNPGIPGASDRVIILNGRTVTTSTGYTVLSAQINEGGTLDIGNTTGHNFGDVRGQGLLRLNTNTFPTGTFTDFVSSSGGTVEYYDLNNTLISNTQLTYNNLIVSNNTTSAYSVYIENSTSPVYTVNGDFTLKNNSSGSLTFRFGNPTATSNNKINLTVYGDFTVNTGCSVLASNFTAGQAYNSVHNLNLYGDLTNNGSIRFTGLPSPAANAYYLLGTTTYGGTNYGAVKVTFSGSTNNTVTCNGVTDFYRFIVDKGIDQTYMVEVNASVTANFGLYGPNNQGGNTFDGPPEGYGTGVYEKALFIYHGTLKLNDNISIPSITEGGQDFNIIPSACLWINGATVSTTVVGVNGTGYQAATLYGKIKVSAGSFSTGDAAGIVLGSSATPEIYVEGTATFSASQVWSAGSGNKISYIQTGGTTNIRGNGEVHAGYMLGLSNPNTVFTMTGGTLNFLNAIFTGTQGMDLRAATGNYIVTGGTVNINLPGGITFDINTTVPFWNLDITRASGGGNLTARFLNTSSSTVSILNDLTLNANTVLDAGTNTVSLNVGHDFTMNANSTYTPGNNTTTFDGTSGQRFTNAGTINGGTGLYNLVLSNASNSDILSNNLIVRSNLTINENCYLNDIGRTISIAGNVLNSGTHTSQAGGGVLLNGTTDQTIGGSGTGIFGNLLINKTAGTASFTANQALIGNLRLVNGLLDISTYNLSLGAASNVFDALYPAVTFAFSGTKMIRTAGNMSDGGLSKEYSATATSFVFPVGTASDYTPATIQFTSAPSAWGTLNLKPVAQYNPFVTSANSLNYYWKVTQSGFGGIADGSISHTYHYIDADLVGRGIEADYIPGVYNPYAWTYINDISQVVDATNDIRFTGVNYASGDFTAGEINAFQPVTVFYSIVSGNWDDLSTWSNTSNAGPADATILPGAGNPVVIGDGGTNNHTVTVTTNSKNVGGLQINSGSILDITTSTGHNFGAIPDSKITGTGRLKISSSAATAAFPGGDFGNFLTSGGGTVEYYTSGTAFTLPASVTYYNHLILSPAAQIITMPDINLNVYGNYSVGGTGTAYLNISANPRTLTVDGSVIITGGILQFRNGSVQSIYVNNDINIFAGASFDIGNVGNAVNNLYVTGNLDNSGSFDMITSATRACNVYFNGDENKTISGNGTNEFNYLYVNKGNSRNTVLNVTANNMTLSGAGTSLVLNNGTFRVSNSSLGFTLSTTSSFTIPSTAALSVNQGTVNIGTTNDAGDLILAGRLEIMNSGVVNIGNGGNYNNDIEYSPAGTPEIIITGGTLNVNGQIRRLLNNTLGSLNYSQSAGTVTLSGKNQNTTRAKLEILNTGSLFNMSGGTITVVEGGGSSAYFGDIQLTPETSNVTGGTIQIGNTGTASTGFLINATAPLWNLTIDGTTSNKTVDLRINPLTIKQDFIINGNSVFRANGFDVNIGGSLTNQNSDAGTGYNTGGFRAVTATQTTTFDGSGSQAITGSGSNLTNFSNLVVSTGGSLTLSSNSNIRINANLTLNSGTFNDSGNDITVIGNIDNSSIHASSSTSGGIILLGSQKQTISGSGTGVFGNVTLNNSLGIDMVDNSIINGQMTFSNGNLYIDDYMLTFGINATINGTPDADNMILMNGVISDQGVKKLYPASAADFTFPIGVAGKYTPVRYNVTANGSVGTILVKPVNYKHPSTYENPSATNELQYYWYAVSTGFSGLTVDHVYNYSDADALPNETDYVVGQYTPVTYTWAVPAEGLVNAASDNFTITGVGYIDGEYTCGVDIMPSPNFRNMPIYYSSNTANGGNWTDPNAWTLNSDGTGGPAPSYPQGNAAVILTGHTITMNTNSLTAYSVEVNGTLTVGASLYHSIGHVRGGGTINLTSTASGSFVFPAGVYDEFMANTSSTIEFYNNSGIPATLPLKPGNDYKPYQNVIFSGSGVKYMSAENMRVLGNLTINGGTLNNTLHNRNITILGNWTDNNTAATGGFVPGTGRVILDGSNAKQITITGASTIEQFYDLQVNNASGATILGGGQAAVSHNLMLTAGNITTNSTNLLSITNSSATAVIGGGSSSFVNGPLQKRVNSGSYFDFPVGNSNGTRYGNLYVSTVTVTGNYVAQYYNHNPDDDGYDPTSVVNPIDAVSNVEYWRLNGPAATANVRIRWDSQSGIIPGDAASRAKLRIVEWNGTEWENRGNVIVDGGVNSGTIQTSPAVTVTGDHRFTIGAESLPTATITSSDASICDDGSSTSISIDLTGTAPWTIRYKVNGANETTVNNIATSPYTLVVTNALEPLATQGPGSYVFNVSYVRDATGSTGIRDFTKTVTITLNESPNPVISGNQTVAIGENNVIYTTTSFAGHTYLWSYSGTTGTTHNGVLTNNTLDMHWGTVAGSGWVQVAETATTGGCSTTTAHYDVTITDTPNPLVTGPTPVCNNQTVTYRTSKVGIHTYAWTLPSGGGNIVGVTNLDSVVVNWTLAGSYSVQVAETGSSTVTDALPVVVNSLPDNSNVISDPGICNGQTANVILTAAAPGITYQLYRVSDDAAIGSPVSSGPGGDITLPVSPATSTDYYVTATNEYSCSVQLTDIASVTVHPLPVPTLTGSLTVCVGAVTLYTTDNDAGITNYTWNVTGGTYTGGATNQITVTWGSVAGDYEDRIVSVNYTDGNGCAATDDTELIIRVYRIPETGPAYHIPNESNE